MTGIVAWTFVKYMSCLCGQHECPLTLERDAQFVDHILCRQWLIQAQANDLPRKWLVGGEVYVIHDSLHWSTIDPYVWQELRGDIDRRVWTCGCCKAHIRCWWHDFGCTGGLSGLGRFLVIEQCLDLSCCIREILVSVD